MRPPAGSSVLDTIINTALEAIASESGSKVGPTGIGSNSLATVNARSLLMRYKMLEAIFKLSLATFLPVLPTGGLHSISFAQCHVDAYIDAQSCCCCFDAERRIIVGSSLIIA